MAVNRLLDEATHDQYKRPVDISRYIGSQTEMEGGGKRVKRCKGCGKRH